MRLFHYTPGTVPLLVSVPHCGTFIPPEITARMTPEAAMLTDTDWHLEKLYDFARGMGVHVLTATHSRYVIDLNRDPSGQSLYPGQFTTGLCPTHSFAEKPLYRSGEEPESDEIAQRVVHYWQPYHDRLRATLEAMKAQHGVAMLFEAHSIASHVPSLFEGELPALNLGTYEGRSCGEAFAQRCGAICASSGHSAVVNGRFKGGYITRHYGQPENGVHAIQLEMVQKLYMQETAPFAYDEAAAEKIQPVLRALLHALIPSAA